MHQAELLVVQLIQAREFIQEQSIARVRLGLILIDNAVELLMQQQIGQILWTNETYGELIRLIEEHGTQNERDEETLVDARSAYVEPKRLAKIEREFSAKAGFLAERDVLSSSESSVLVRLHMYRNETYHRGKLRTGSIKTCANLYYDLACAFLGRFSYVYSEIIMKTQALRFEPKLHNFLDQTSDDQWLTQRSFGELLSLKRDSGRTIRDSLSDHLEQRLAGMVEVLSESAEHLGDKWTTVDVFHLVQMPDATNNLEEVRSATVEHPYSRIEKWKSRANRLRSANSDIDGFRLFAGIEDEFEPIEDSLELLSSGIDEAIQDSIDRARGK